MSASQSAKIASSSKIRKRALVTGASSGIGRELALRFAREGHDLILVARNGQKLRELADQLKRDCGVSANVIPKDLSKPQAPEEIFQELQREGILIDILVNNAGVGTYGPFSESNLSRELEMMRLNMISLTHLTHLFLKEAVLCKEGKILNVASTAAFQPGPLMAVYYASKAYVLSFSEALAEELRGSGVTVTVLCPGPTESEFQKTANMGKIRLLAKSFLMDSATVAKAGYEGLMKGRTVVIPGFKNKLSVLGAKWAPRKWVVRAVRMIQTRTR